MSSPSASMDTALAGLKSMLAADGYDLEVSAGGGARLVARITAGPDACADCLVPKALMRTYFEQALKPVCELGVPEIELHYPGDKA